VTQKVLQLLEYQKASALSIFLSMPGQEISTSTIVSDALHQGKKVFIPYIHSDAGSGKSKTMDMLRLKDQTDLQSLKPDAWGIPSLPAEGIEDRENALGGHGTLDASDPDQTTCELDLIFMPGTAFDSSNNRLGHGKGFYDRYLSRIRQRLDNAGTSQRFPRLSMTIFAGQNQVVVLTILQLPWLFASNFFHRIGRFPYLKMTGR